MNVSVFGLGYVGCVSVGCLSSVGHNIIGVDINKEKLNTINNGKSTVIENGLDELIYAGISNGTIKTSSDLSYAIRESDMAIICVGTPNNKQGFLEMEYVENVVAKIAKELSFKKFFTISIRSTVMPGTNDRLCKLVEKISGKKNNIDFFFYGDICDGDDIIQNNLDIKKMKLLYQLTDIQLITSASEGGPKSIPEGMLTRNLVLSTNVGHSNDYLSKDFVFNTLNDFSEALIFYCNVENYYSEKTEYTINNNYVKANDIQSNENLQNLLRNNLNNI